MVLRGENVEGWEIFLPSLFHLLCWVNGSSSWQDEGKDKWRRQIESDREMNEMWEAFSPNRKNETISLILSTRASLRLSETIRLD